MTVCGEAEASRLAARVVIEAIDARGPGARVGLATGRSPRELYRELLAAEARGEVALGSCTYVMLDEYLGLDPGDPRLFRWVLEREFLSMVRGEAPRLVALGGGGADPAQFAAEVAHNPVDVQILGIGRNGHIGFNEPGSPFDSRTREVDLAETTTADMVAAGWPPQEVPTRALTQGLADIAAAGTVVLLAFGAAKAQALCDALAGEAHPGCPASVLQSHPHAMVFADEAAAALL